MGEQPIKRNSQNKPLNFKGYVSRPLPDIKSRTVSPQKSNSPKHYDIVTQNVTKPQKSDVRERKPHAIESPIPRQRITATQQDLHQVHVTNHRYQMAGIPTLPIPSKFSFFRSKKSSKQYVTKSSRRKRTAKIFIIFTSFVILAALIISAFSIKSSIQANREKDVAAKKVADSAVIIKSSQDTFMEDVLSGKDLSNFQSAPDTPKYLRINQLGILSRTIIVPDTVHLPVSPKNIHDTVWYSASAKPGTSTTTAVVMGGNIAGPTKPAIFNSITTIKIDDRVVVAQGNNTEFGYKVVAIEPVNSETYDARKAFKPFAPGKEGLNIVATTLKDKNDSLSITPTLVVYAVRDN